MHMHYAVCTWRMRFSKQRMHGTRAFAERDSDLQVRKMYKMQEWPEPTFLQPLQFLLDSTLRLGLHAAISLAVLLHPAMWTSLVYCALAGLGLVYMNGINYRSVVNAPQSRFIADKVQMLLGRRKAAYKVHAA